MVPNTHLGIREALCGRPTAMADGQATVVLDTTAEMGADAQGLVHGGFVFGAADYAAMLAVNDPNVVLGGADVRFLKPVAVGEPVRFDARVTDASGKRRDVAVSGHRGDDEVFRGTFTCFVLPKHVLAD